MKCLYPSFNEVKKKKKRSNELLSFFHFYSSGVIRVSFTYNIPIYVYIDLGTDYLHKNEKATKM